MKMKKGNSRHSEWNLQGFSRFWSSIFVSLWPVADTEHVLECIIKTNIKTGDNTPFRISIYGKREDFAFRIVNFLHMDSNIPANPAYGV